MEHDTIDGEVIAVEDTPITKRDTLKELSTSLASLIQAAGPSREASLATTKLDEFFFWGSAALTVEEARVAAAERAGE